MSGFPGTIFGTGTTTVTGTQIGAGNMQGGGGASGGGGSSFGSGFLKVLGTVLNPQMIAAYRNAITGGIGSAVITGQGGEQIHVVGTAGGKLYQVGTPNMQPAAGVDPSATVSGGDNTGMIIMLGLVAAGAYFFAKRRR